MEVKQLAVPFAVRVLVDTLIVNVTLTVFVHPTV